MYINFQQNRANRSVITVHTNVFSKNRKLHKFATTNRNFKHRLFQTCIVVKRKCLTIFSKIGLVDQSKSCTQIYLQNCNLSSNFKKSRLSNMHCPLTDSQADFEINRPVRYRNTAKKIFPRTTDGQTDGRTDIASDDIR